MINRRHQMDQGYISMSFMMTFSVFVFLVFSLLRYHYSLTHTFLKQEVLIEAQRMAFQQLDIYPTSLQYDRHHWFLETQMESEGIAQQYIKVTVRHRTGYMVQQKRILSVQKRINPTPVNPRLRKALISETLH